jgi:hypothetical protein
MKHRASKRFWQCYNELPEDIQNLADKNYELLKTSAQYPSLHFKKVGDYWSARVGLGHRALAVEEGDDLVWFWIGGMKNMKG